jgi:16S rRNA processing protein RimM
VTTADDARVPVGYVRRAHGIRGEVILRPLTDNPERFAVGSRMLTDETPPREVAVVSRRVHKDGVLVGFEGVDDRSAAEGLQGVTLTIARSERRTLDEDEYWPEDLQGLVVVTPDGEHVGTVTGVVLGEAQDRLVVTTGAGSQVEVPFVDALVGEVHPSLGHLVVDLPEGLL